MLSRIRRFPAALILRIGLWFLNVVETTQKTAKGLRFLHFARWTLVSRRRLPRLHANQPKESLRHGLLFFCTSYDGDWDDYIGSFSSVLWCPLDFVFGRCVGFPGARPERVLKDYVRKTQHEPDLWYCAYTDAGVHDVRVALDLYEKLECLCEESYQYDAHGFAAAYKKLLAESQQALGSTRRAGPPLPRPSPRDTETTAPRRIPVPTSVRAQPTPVDPDASG